MSRWKTNCLLPSQRKPLAPKNSGSEGMALILFLSQHTWWMSVTCVTHSHGHRYSSEYIIYKFLHTGYNVPSFLLQGSISECKQIGDYVWSGYSEICIFKNQSIGKMLCILPIIKNKLSEHILPPWHSLGYFTSMVVKLRFREMLTLLLNQKSRNRHPQGEKSGNKLGRNHMKEQRLWRR